MMDWGLALAITATGMIVVFAVLILLVIIFSLIGKFMDYMTNKPKKAKEAKKGAEAPAVGEKTEESSAVEIELGDGVSDEVIAAISAAVTVVMTAEGKSFRLRSVKRKKESRPAWSAAGIQENTRPF